MLRRIKIVKMWCIGYNTRILVLFIFIHVLGTMHAQDSIEFDKIYTKTYIETSQKDFDLALKISDSLFQASTTPFFQAKSIMLTASLYEQKGEIRKSIEKAKIAASLIDKTQNFNWQSRIQGFLATQYRLMSIYGLSSKHLEKAISAAKKIEDKEVSRITLAMVMQEKAFLADVQKKYQQALDYFLQVAELLGDKEGEFLVAQNYQFIGQCALNLKNYDDALMYFNKALTKWGDLPLNYVKGLIYLGLADVYLYKEDYNLVDLYLAEAKEVEGLTPYMEYKKKYYEFEAKYFFKISDKPNFEIASHKKDSISAILSSNKSEFLDASYSELVSNNFQFEQLLNRRRIIIIIISILLIAGSIWFYLFRRNKKLEHKEFVAIIENLERIIEFKKKSQAAEHKVQDKIDSPKTKPPQSSAKGNSLQIPEDVQNEILASLAKFEETEIFTNPEFTGV